MSLNLKLFIYILKNLSLLLFVLINIILFFKLNKKIYPKDNITLVTALFKLKTNRHKFNSYFNWIKNLLSINSSIIIFTDNYIYKRIKGKRPKIYNNKTIWIKYDFSNLYSYKHFKKDFIKSYKIDRLKNKHNVQLFIVWAEKCFFLKKSIYRNFFGSKCFYWIDAGYFRDNNMSLFLNNWPSIKKCNEDPRVIINGIRILHKNEINGLKSFDFNTHYKFMNNFNIGSALFGGKSNYLIKFIYLYYKTLKLFIKKEKFIGSEQNLFTFIAYLYPKIVNLINSRKWYYFKELFFNIFLSFISSFILNDLTKLISY